MKKIMKKKTIYFHIVISYFICRILMALLVSTLYNALEIVVPSNFLEYNALVYGFRVLLNYYICPYYFVYAILHFKQKSGKEMPDLKDCLKKYAAFLKVLCFFYFCIGLYGLLRLSLSYILYAVIGIIFFLTTFIRFMQNKIKENKKNQLELFADVMETEEHNE